MPYVLCGIFTGNGSTVCVYLANDHINGLTGWLQIEISLSIKTSIFIKVFIYKDVFYIACDTWQQRIGLLPNYMKSVFISGF